MNAESHSVIRFIERPGRGVEIELEHLTPLPAEKAQWMRAQHVAAAVLEAIQDMPGVINPFEHPVSPTPTGGH